MTTTPPDTGTTAPGTSVTSSELLSVVASRELAARRAVFAGIGLPTLATELARLTVAPEIEVVYESGVCGAHPSHLPETIADAVLISGAEAVLSMPALFGYVLQGGHIDVGFLGAAQIDRWGNLNTSVIGDWERPEVRLPGSGGAVEVMAGSREVFVVMRRHDPRSFTEFLDFCTTPGPDRALAEGIRPRGAGVTRVITELGVLAREGVGDQLRLVATHPGVTVDQVRAATGWELAVADRVATVPPPTAAELRLLREDVDPGRVYLR
ncbi:3-oxoadipate--succinyl-CoA transferase [Streptomyces halstedii]|uniref:3-oxoadipate--succinyl-CoA transferase n=1 Tax=Streptomyces TaxID=1883 RepID=UPI00048E3D0A|nr:MULTISPECIES: 3-oxoadipate--succinyl-CoA transferase [unclassified Streptomyces]WSX35198.1 3-oxoadipate--succinyl-CoA transferase [Streptomyces halstedii]KDQ70374.1 3-oxoadipate:succinyl-CoA transferase [Streptomyces sp. NTK 937]MYR71835.1 3-oxoadipate--succinyl-CoA transferase [Streptomyces sp. SID4925]MYY16080.1 3-oxoadipate--succinyl-CoA transferase [Streptomyces sp. SID4912]SBU92306.1 glutaconate CoA-transferase subunit B [Streptomyces sp. OspMP-M45]